MKPRKITKANKLTKLLRADILNGSLAAGEKLPMDFLKNRYGMGFSPLREALSSLVAYGLVNVEEQCGFKVAELSISELYDLYKVREYIDTLALTLSMEHGDTKWESQVVASWHQYEKFLTYKKGQRIHPDEWEQQQKNFDAILISACQSPWLLKIHNILYDQAARYRALCINLHIQHKKHLQAFINENKLLVSAVIDRNNLKVIKLCRASWANAIETIAKQLKIREAQ